MSKILKKLLDLHDLPAREITIKYINGSYSNGDKYGVDVLINNNNENSFNKIEVQTLTYPTFINNFNLLTVFSRKDRYDEKTLYITYNFNYSKCFIFCRCQLKKEQMKEIKANYSIHQNDKVYYIYKKDVLYIDEINEESFNIDILNKFYSSTNTK